MSQILVAEDSFALANLLCFILKNAGFEVDLHRTGQSAYEALCKRRYDIICLDQQMPQMTGLEIIESIRSSGPNCHTPVFLCTAKSHEICMGADRERLAISAIIHKPFSPKELVALLQNAAEPLKVSLGTS